MSSDCGTVAAVTRTSTGLHFTWSGFMCVGLKSEKVADLPVQAIHESCFFGPAVVTGFEGQQTVGVSTVNGALCLLHTSHTPPEGLLEKTQSVLAQARGERM